MAMFAALPLFTDSYLADTRHLTRAQHGTYLLLLILMWRSPQCRIPNDHEWIAKRLQISTEEMEAEVVPILQDFCSMTGKWVTQKRLCKEFSYLSIKRKKQSDSAKSRWNKEKIYANAMPENESWHAFGNAPTPTPTDSLPSPTETRAEPALDLTKTVFDSGIKILGVGGIEPHQARALIGKWRKDHGDATVLETLGRCQNAGISEPVAWMTAALKPKPKAKPESEPWTI